MRARYLPLVLVLLGADSPAPHGGSITGSVVAVKNGKPIARDDIYVYLQPVGRARAKTLPGVGVRKEIIQKDKHFVPRVVVIPTGGEVWFPNADADTHNVFSPTDPVFDLGRYPGSKKGKGHKFEDPDEFDIFCDIHPEMWAKVKVVDSPYIAQVVGGKFTFSNIPAGKYKVVAWVRNSPEVHSGELVVADGKATALDRELHLQVATRSGCHERKDGTQYGKQDYGKCPEDY
jgi:plastocyanin